MTRSARRETRNPILGLPAARQLAELPAEAAEAIAAVLADLEADARARADKAWRSHKAPMAAYWKAAAVYARHTRRACSADPMLYLIEIVMPTRDECDGPRNERRTYTRRSALAAKRKADQLAELFGRRRVTLRPASQGERFPVCCC